MMHWNKLLSGVVKSGPHRGHGSGKGDVTKPQVIHLSENASLRVLCPVSGKWTPSCSNHNYSMIPLLLGSGVTKLLNISKYETLMTVPSQTCVPMTWLTATSAYIITCCWWASTLIVKWGFCLAPKKFQDMVPQWKAHLSENRTLPWDKAVGNHSDSSTHALWHCVMPAWLAEFI
jgi:hypothetical protein